MLENILFSEAVKVEQLHCAAITAQKLPASTAFIDVSKYSRFAFLIGIGAVDEASTYQVMQDTSATQTAGVANVTDAKVVVAAATGDNKWYLIEVETARLKLNDDFKFVTLDVSGPTDGDDIAAVFFLGFNDKAPVTQGTDKGEVVTIAG